MSLSAFFEHVGPFLRGEMDAHAFEVAMGGESPSGADDLAFYSTLVHRNYAKILRSLFPAVRARYDGDWSAFASRFVAETKPATTNDPNGLGEGFPDFLGALHEQGELEDSLLQELADYAWIRYCATHAPPDFPGDGFDVRLFSRLYTYDIPAITRQLERGEALADEPQPVQTYVIVYRCLRRHKTIVRPASLTELVVLTKREHGVVPDLPAAIQPETLLRAEADLIERGALLPQSETP